MIRIEAIPRDELLARHRAEVAVVWTDATRERVGEILPRHAARDGFRFLAARSSAGALAGFAYGYIGAPGQWWHDIVAAAMSPAERDRWLAPGHFEFAELHVHPGFRRRGIGGRLHDELLEGLSSRTAVLSTQVDNEPALALYRGRGWRIVVDELDFGTGRLYKVLARELADG